MEDAASDDGRDQLLNKEKQKNAADGSEVEVVNEEQRLELEGLTAAHQLATSENDGVVDDDEDGRRLERRHGRLERNELEVIGRVADDGSPSLVEDGPQVDAKRAVHRGQRQLLVECRHGSGGHGGLATVPSRGW